MSVYYVQKLSAAKVGLFGGVVRSGAGILSTGDHVPLHFGKWLGTRGTKGVFLGLSVLELGPIYATDVRQTDVRQMSDKSIA